MDRVEFEPIGLADVLLELAFEELTEAERSRYLPDIDFEDFRKPEDYVRFAECIRELYKEGRETVAAEDWSSFIERTLEEDWADGNDVAAARISVHLDEIAGSQVGKRHRKRMAERKLERILQYIRRASLHPCEELLMQECREKAEELAQILPTIEGGALWSDFEQSLAKQLPKGANDSEFLSEIVGCCLMLEDVLHVQFDPAMIWILIKTGFGYHQDLPETRQLLTLLLDWSARVGYPITAGQLGEFVEHSGWGLIEWALEYIGSSLTLEDLTENMKLS